ncbi:MAG: ABC transporter substrate-binding protein [Rhodobacteraceae bacterium]|nr:ABC transporter substrate-binding protein [Paracoccaceae bacterium]
MRNSIVSWKYFLAAYLIAVPAMSETTINIAGWGAKSGPLRSFGVNSQAIIDAAITRVNENGGVTLEDGTKAMMAVEYYDSGCNAEQGIAVARKVASETNALIGIGPTCSGVAAASFGVFQKKVDDASDTGLQMALLTDTAVRNGLAKISQWTFRNTPNEPDMYDKLFAWVAENRPEIKTIYGGTETDQGHSAGTYSKVIVQAAVRHGFEWVNGPIEGVNGTIVEGFKNVLSSSSNWLMADTNFSVQARAFKKSGADMFIVSSHPFTTCGFLKELYRQKGMPKMLVGLTSSSSAETMKGCSKQVEGMIIPTSFAPITDAAKEVAALAEANGGAADLHSAAAWENVMIIKQVIESVGITGDPANLQDERRKIRDGLEALETTEGLLGTVSRVQDEGEALKPYVFVQAQSGNWEVIHDPR